MPKIEPEVEAFARIKVIGVGGAGGNAINHMINAKVRGVDFIAMNTDVQDIHKSSAAKKVHIGKNLTKGLGAGMNPEVGKRAAEETKEEIQEAIKGADMVFIAAGMGGGTGTGAAPVVARSAKESGALTVGVVTKPFFFEGTQRMKLAMLGLDELQKEVDALIVIPNDRLLATIQKEVTAKTAFAMSDEILRQAVEGISDLITTPGIINVDFADIRAVMANAGSALMGIGKASGDTRAEEAARAAINSPLLDLSINGAHGVLFAIAGGDDLGMFEIQQAAKIITETIDKDAKVIFGAIHDPKLAKSEVKVTVIASGFPQGAPKNPLFSDDLLINHRRDKTPETPAPVQPPQKPTEPARPEPPATPEPARPSINSKKDDILTSLSNTRRPDMTPRPSQPQPPRPNNNNNDDSDSDWSSAVPAFLRRK